MSKNKGSLGKKNGGEGRLSKKAIQERIRTHSEALLNQAVYIAFNGDSDSNKLGAIKLLMSKIVPDLKAQEIEGDLGLKIQYVVTLPPENSLDTTQGTTDRSLKES